MVSDSRGSQSSGSSVGSHGSRQPSPAQPAHDPYEFSDESSSSVVQPGFPPPRAFRAGSREDVFRGAGSQGGPGGAQGGPFRPEDEGKDLRRAADGSFVVGYKDEKGANMIGIVVLCSSSVLVSVPSFPFM